MDLQSWHSWVVILGAAAAAIAAYVSLRTQLAVAEIRTAIAELRAEIARGEGQRDKEISDTYLARRDCRVLQIIGGAKCTTA